MSAAGLSYQVLGLGLASTTRRRAAVGSGVASRRSSLIGAGVFVIQDHVAVVIRIRATVRILEPIHVFCVVWAKIIVVENVVGIIVHFRASVFIFEAIVVFGLIGTPVEAVPNAVFVLIGGRAPLQISNSIRDWTFVLSIQNTITVVVSIWTAVFVSETVEIFGFYGALIVAVGVTVAVSVTCTAAEWTTKCSWRLEENSCGQGRNRNYLVEIKGHNILLNIE